MSLSNIRSVLNQWQKCVDTFAIFLHEFLTTGSGPPAALAVAAGGAAYRPPVLPPTGPPQATLDDGFLWAVPKHRRSVERRMMRRYGADNWPNGRKLIKPKNNLIFCFKCGGHHLPGMLCMTCYSRVMEETREVQKAVAAEQGLTPPDREVAVLYRGERDALDDQQAEVVRLVELPKERPQWFSKNLSQRTTAASAPAETAAVKPSDLG